MRGRLGVSARENLAPRWGLLPSWLLFLVTGTRAPVLLVGGVTLAVSISRFVLKDYDSGIPWGVWLLDWTLSPTNGDGARAFPAGAPGIPGPPGPPRMLRAPSGLLLGARSGAFHPEF